MNLSMNEMQAKDLAAVIAHDVPWLTVSTEPAHWFDSSVSSEDQRYVVVIAGKAFSAELYHWEEWQRLVDAFQDAEANQGPLVVGQDALEAWLTSQRHQKTRMPPAVWEHIAERQHAALLDQAQASTVDALVCTFACIYCLNYFRVPLEQKGNLHPFLIQRPDGIASTYLLKILVPTRGLTTQLVTLTVEKERGREVFAVIDIDF